MSFGLNDREWIEPDEQVWASCENCRHCIQPNPCNDDFYFCECKAAKLLEGVKKNLDILNAYLDSQVYLEESCNCHKYDEAEDDDVLAFEEGEPHAPNTL